MLRTILFMTVVVLIVAGIPALIGIATYLIWKKPWMSLTIFIVAILINLYSGFAGWLFFKIIGPW